MKDNSLRRFVTMETDFNDLATNMRVKIFLSYDFIAIYNYFLIINRMRIRT